MSVTRVCATLACAVTVSLASASCQDSSCKAEPGVLLLQTHSLKQTVLDRLTESDQADCGDCGGCHWGADGRCRTDVEEAYCRAWPGNTWCGAPANCFGCDGGCIFNNGVCYQGVAFSYCSRWPDNIWCGDYVTTQVPATTSTTPAPSTSAKQIADCGSCVGDHACIWSDGQCHPRVAESVCKVTQGAVWCGTSATTTPTASTTAATVTCETCEGDHPCIWPDGKCYPRVARNVCEETQGAVWCGASEPTTTALPTATSLTTTSQTTTTTEPSSVSQKCVAGGVQLDMATSAVTHSNLGGAGPDGGEENMRFHHVGSTPGQVGVTSEDLVTSFDLVVRATGGNFRFVPAANGLRGSYGEISLTAPSNATLTFSFEDSLTGEPVVLSAFHFQLYDIDQSLDAQERVLIGGFENYTAHPQTEVAIEATEDGRTLLKSTEFGAECDNPRANPQDLGVVTCREGAQAEHTVDQRKRAVSFLFLEKSSFEVSLEAAAAPACTADVCGFRNFLFTGTC